MDHDTLQMLREGKAARDAEGTVDERADVVLALAEAGISGWGPGVATDTLKAWLADPAAAPRSASKVAVDQFADSGAPKVRRAGEAASNQFGVSSVHPASDKQIAFLKRLIAEKAWEGHTDTAGEIKIPADVDTIGKKPASRLIDRLMGCPDKAATARPASARPAAPLASEKQMSFIARLMGERDYFSLDAEGRRRWDSVASGKTPTSKGASEFIDTLKVTSFAKGNGTGEDLRGGSDSRSVKGSDDALELGMYRKADGTMYRVYPARQSDRILAKRLVSDGEGGWTFEYAGMASRFVKADERMTLEEAKAWGATFGTCCVCAALLTDPESVANGIGPICGSRV